MAAAIALTGCVSAGTRDPYGCAPGLKPATTAELVFGRSFANGPGVSDADWQAFVDTEVTPRFPEGLTVMDAVGQWRGASGAVIVEPSKVLLLVLDGAPGEAAEIEAVRAAYRARFRQESVLLIERRGCVGF